MAQAAISEGKYAQAFPSFGPERRGAPVQAFVRVDEKPILVRAEVTEPDIVVVLDTGLLGIINVTSGLKRGGVLIVNTKGSLGDIESKFGAKYQIAVVDAIQIARELLGAPIVNTTMLGALIRATGIVKLESLVEPLKKRFGRLAEKNISAMKKAYEETLVKERV
jgi:pyruvate ferredoxin oxidoreductase gamma subunit